MVRLARPPKPKTPLWESFKQTLTNKTFLIYMSSVATFFFGLQLFLGGLAFMAALLAGIRQPFRPNQVVALCYGEEDRAAHLISLLAHRLQMDGRATAYVCQNYACKLPVNSPDALTNELKRPTGS